MATVRIAIAGFVLAVGLLLTAWQFAGHSGQITAPGPIGHHVESTVY